MAVPRWNKVDLSDCRKKIFCGQVLCSYFTYKVWLLRSSGYLCEFSCFVYSLTCLVSLTGNERFVWNDSLSATASSLSMTCLLKLELFCLLWLSVWWTTRSSPFPFYKVWQWSLMVLMILISHFSPFCLTFLSMVTSVIFYIHTHLLLSHLSFVFIYFHFLFFFLLCSAGEVAAVCLGLIELRSREYSCINTTHPEHLHFQTNNFSHVSSAFISVLPRRTEESTH